MTGYSPDEFVQRKKSRVESVKKHYMMLRDECGDIRLVDTNTKEGRREFDSLFMKDAPILGYFDTSMSFADLLSTIKQIRVVVG